MQTQQAPIAIVNGRADPFLQPGCFQNVRWANLWDNQCFEIPGGHAPFVKSNPEFDELLMRFAIQMDRRASDLLRNPLLSLGG